MQDYFIHKRDIVLNNKRVFAHSIKSSVEINEEIIDTIIAEIINSEAYQEMDIIPYMVELGDIIDEQIVKKVTMANKNRIIISINNSIVDKEKLELLNAIKEQGYKIAISINPDDKYIGYSSLIADIIIIDAESEYINLKDIKSIRCMKLATNVNTPDTFKSVSMWADMYEGDYMSDVVNLDIRRKGYSKANLMSILKFMNDDGKKTINELVGLIVRDPLLTSQILRLGRTVGIGGGNIKEVITKLGMTKVEQWLMLLKFASSQGVADELIEESYFRAIMAKSIQKEFKIKGVTENGAYIVGLLSVIDILEGRLIYQELIALGFDNSIEDAILYRDNNYGKIINMIIAYENADFDKVEQYCNELKCRRQKIFNIYYKSLIRASRIWGELKNEYKRENNS